MLVSGVIVGCSKKEESPELAPPTTSQQGVDLSSAATPPPAVVAGPAGTAPAKAPEGIDFAKAKRPVNDKGDPMSDLEYLNHLVFQLNESRTAGQTIVQKAFKTEAEQMAYEEAQQKKMQPVHSLQELVDAGVLKAIPTGPNGQHYAIDAASGKVVLQ